MIGSIGQTPAVTGMHHPGSAQKAHAVGHQAKTAVAAASEAGAELPKNAQGMAASAIAKGADPESIFAALIAEEEPVVADPDVDGPVEGDVPQDVADETTTAASAEGEETDVISVVSEDLPFEGAESEESGAEGPFAVTTGEETLAIAEDDFNAADAEAHVAAITAYSEAPVAVPAEDMALTLLEEAAAEQA